VRRPRELPPDGGAAPAPHGVRAIAVARAALVVVSSGAIGLHLFALAATFHAMPLLDHWETVADYARFLSHGIEWRRLVAQHNEHRIVVSRLLNLADYAWFHGLGAFLMAVSAALSAACVYLACRFSGARRFGLSGAPAVLSSVALGTSVCQIANLAWSFQTSWYVALALWIAALRTYQLAAPGAAHPRRWLVAAWALAFAATFSSGGGAAVWPALLVTGALSRQSRAAQLGTAAVGALAIGLYFTGYRAPSHHPAFAIALRDPRGMLEFVALYATNSLQAIGEAPQVVLGGALVLLVGVELASARRRGARNAQRAFALALFLLLLATAAMTAVSRLPLGGPAYANANRYATYGLFMVLAGLMLASWRFAGLARPPAFLGALAALVLATTWSGFAGPPWNEALYIKALKLEVELCDAAASCPADNLMRVYPDVPLIRERMEFLRSRHLAHFAPEVARSVAADALAPLAAPGALPDCRGFVDGVDRTADGHLQVRGWLVWPGGRELPDAVGIYSPGGERLGGGGVCEPRMDVQRALHVPLRGAFRDFGFRAWAPEVPDGFYVVGWFADGKRLCKVSGRKNR
jgi:hypothetical protein